MKLVMETQHLDRCLLPIQKKWTSIVFTSACSGKRFHCENQETQSHSEIPVILKLSGNI